MTSSSKKARALVGALVATMALFAVSAASASASVPAQWVNPGSIVASGSLTLKQNGANEKVCTAKTNVGSAINAEGMGAMILETPSWGAVEFSCPGGSLLLYLSGSTNFETNYFVAVPATGSSSLFSPYGTYTSDAYNVNWTNASGTTASTLNFSSTKFGHNAGGSITASGNLTVKRGTGANITLTH